MTPLFKKLNLKDPGQIVVLNAPASFEPELEALDGVTVVRDLKGVREIEFALTFVIQQKELDRLGEAVTKRATGDAVVWFAYPKGSSKKYKSELNRDHGWAVLGKAGFEGVRQVAIDEDWSATRFRRVEFIKTMNRDPRGAMSAKGKARTAKRA